MKFALHLLLAGAIFGSSTAVAADKKKAEEPELPQTGIIASTLSTGQEAAVDNPYSGVNVSAVSGSVSKMGDKVTAKLFNNSEDKYSVSAVVEQLRNGRVIKKDYMNTTLLAGKSYSRTFSARGDNPRLRVTRIKNLTPPQEEEKSEEAAAEKKPDAKPVRQESEQPKRRTRSFR